MTTTTYEDVLDQARCLPPEERQLGETLVTHGPAAPSMTAAPPTRPLSDDDRARLEAWFVAADELAARIGAAWKDDMNAVEAVNEQRREL
jgi:hypothetical protein